MYKISNIWHQIWISSFKDIIYLVQHVLSFALMIIGISHLPAEFLVQDYTQIYHTDFNAQQAYTQLILLSWVKCIGVLLILQGVLMWRYRLHFHLCSNHHDLKPLGVQLLIDIALLFSLWHISADIKYFFIAPAIIVVLIHLSSLLIYLILYIINQ